MARPRWMKLVRDVRAERGRLGLMIAAIAVSLAGTGAVLGAYAVLTREIRANYLGTRPAAATLELADGVDPGLVAAVRGVPGISEAEAREVVVARARVGDGWRRLLLFVVEDFRDQRLNRFRLERGDWPPPDGTMLVERKALGMLETDVGGRVVVKTPAGAPVEVGVSGVVHDPGLAPAWQERCGYGYVTRATLARLGEAPVLRELRISLTGEPRAAREIEARAAGVASWLAGRGHAVREIRVPPPGRHPHELQMRTILVMMIAFAGMALVLSAILVATSLAALLARQVREIGVMKAIGATASQIARLYVLLVALLGAGAALASAPLGLLGARVFARAISGLLNFNLGSGAIPPWVFAVQLAAGIGVPLLVSAIPIARASRRSVREAMDDHGISQDRPPRGSLAALPLPLRNALRRPARLALALALLAAGGAMAISAIQVKLGWEANVAKVYETHFHDVDVILHSPAPAALADEIARIPGVRIAEAWGYADGAFTRPGEIDVVRTYPDRAHGALRVMGPPPGTPLLRLPLRAGRWLEPRDADTRAVVLNHLAAAQKPGLGVGDEVALSLDGSPATWQVVGIVEEIGSNAAAYVADAAFGAAAATPGRSRLLRVATDARSGAERTEIIRRIEEVAAADGAAIESIMPLAEIRTAVGDHILVLVRALVALALVFGVVGALGLASTMGVSVLERTRELAVMKTLGATPGRLARMLVAEGLTIAALSFALACALSVPLTLLVDGLVGRLGFLAPLPLVLSPPAAAAWLALSFTVALAATLLPARRAGAIVVREALGRT